LAGGSKKYLEYIVLELKENNMIDQELSVSNVNELLDFIYQSSDYTLNLIDLPPVSIDEFKGIINDLKQSYQSNPIEMNDLYKSLEILWDNIQSYSEKSKISPNQINGILAMELMKKGWDYSLIASKASLSLINDEVIGSYQETFKGIQKVGYDNYLRKHMSPFIKQIKRHFKKDKPTLTEKLLNRNKK
jgi:hypothetical protein